VWKDFPSSYDTDFDWLMGQRRLLRMTSFPGTLVDLPGRAKDDYFTALKGGQRRNLKRKLRRSAEAVDVAVEMIQNPTARTIDEVFALFQQSYERATTQFERLNRRFFEIIAAQPMAHFVVLRERKSGDMLAFMLGFDMGGRVIHKYLGIDYHRPQEWALYFRLWDAIVDWALARGATAIQSGQTGYGGKIDVGHRLVPLTVYARHRHAVVHSILRAIGGMVSWKTLDDDLADFLKRLLTARDLK
jgi:predicted N-acyltransferase